jgi:hypothetical protein
VTREKEEDAEARRQRGEAGQLRWTCPWSTGAQQRASCGGGTMPSSSADFDLLHHRINLHHG